MEKSDANKNKGDMPAMQKGSGMWTMTLDDNM